MWRTYFPSFWALEATFTVLFMFFKLSLKSFGSSYNVCLIALFLTVHCLEVIFLCGFVWLHLVLSVRVEKHWPFSFYKPELPQSWVRLFSDWNESPEEQSSADARVRLKISFRVKLLCINIRLFRYSVETAVHTGSLRLLPHLAPFSVECVYFVC